MSDGEYNGLLCIGDPHLAVRPPGARIDDYPRAILDKLAFCLSYAARENLLPALLGDVFHAADEDADWLLDELVAMLAPARAIGIFGNHDCADGELGERDALARVAERCGLSLLDDRRLWRGRICGRRGVVGGAPWGLAIPSELERDARVEAVIWLAHAELLLPGSDAGIVFRAVPGIDLVVNGHVHSRLPLARVGATTWCNPGSIARYSGSATARSREPAALRVDLGPSGLAAKWIPVPHRPAAQVFD